MKQNKYVVPISIIILAVSLTACSVNPISAVVSMLDKSEESSPTVTEPITAPVTADEAQPANTTTEVVIPSTLAGYESALEAVYAKVNPSVVNIQVTSTVTASSLDLPDQFQDMPGFEFYFGDQGGSDQQQSPQVSQSLGSGFVWNEQGYIVTNNHVVEGATKIEVKFSNGAIWEAELVGADPDSDLAVIKLKDYSGELTPVTISQSSAVKVGQVAIAIGNPYGLENTMTTGIVSAIGRSISADMTSTGATFSIPDIIQTDAPINPGNSGGVLVNSNGDLIGVTSAIESSSGANAGIGFAIPSDTVLKVIPALITNGKYEHSYLGLTGTTLTPDLAEAMGVDASQRGVLVVAVNDGGPADKAGLKGSSKTVTIDGQDAKVGGDIITAINDQPLTAMDDLISYLGSSTSVGDNVSLSILRNGKTETVEANLIARPTSIDGNTTTAQESGKQSTASAWLGVSVQSMNSAIAEAMDLPENQKGVLVVDVEAGSPADLAGIQGGDTPAIVNSKRVMVGGDIILAVGDQQVNSTADLKQALAKLNVGDEVTLTIQREGNQQEVSITLAERPQ